MRKTLVLLKTAIILGLMIAACVITSRAARATDADYVAPTGYYDSAIGLTGSALKAQLTTIMTTGFVARSYGDSRYAFAVTDKDPNNSSNILLIYNRASVSSTWDGGSTFNREHTWPCSLLGIDTPSNSYKGVASDLFMLRPCDDNINSSRSNSPYGTTTSSGTYGYKTSGYWYPGDADAGDIARGMFYAATRWSSYNNLTLVNGSPSTYQMGDLQSLLKWHYTDTPDTFERYRNQAIYSSTLNPTYYQGNRNAYIDHPEYVWSVFVNQQNDSQITASSTSVNLGRVIVGSSIGTQSVTLNKTGTAGTYYSVTASGAAVSTVSGSYNAFALSSAASTVLSKSVNLSLNSSTTTAGRKSGAITVDNLDITTEGGAGKGANDANDVVTVYSDVVDHASASFAGSTKKTAVTLNFGTLAMNSGKHALALDVFNQEQTASYTAALDLDSFSLTGNSSVFSSTLATFSNLAAGSSKEFSVYCDTATAGTFTATYSLVCSDENIAGAQTYSPMTVTLTGTIAAVPEPAVCLTLIGLGAAAFVVRRRNAK